MVKNEQTLHYKHPNGELAMDGVVKKFTSKKGVSYMTRKETVAKTNKEEEVAKAIVEVVVSDSRNPGASVAYFEGKCPCSQEHFELNRPVAVRCDFNSVAFYEAGLGHSLSKYPYLGIRVIKGITKYYIYVYMFMEVPR